MRKSVGTTFPFNLLLLLAMTGCGSPDPLNRGGTLAGAVTIDGEPVTAGNILLISADGAWTGTAPLRGDGTYTIQEPPLGTVKVAIQTEMYRGRPLPTKYASPQVEGQAASSRGMVLPDPSVRGLIYKEIPAKYEQVETSGLTCVVTKGHQQQDFPLTSK